MQILNDRQIRLKIRRIAIEILEHHFGEKVIVFAGLNNNGFGFAQLLTTEIAPFLPNDMGVKVTRVRLNPANPLEYSPYCELDADEIAEKVVILVDDVANTGRTLFYACQPLMNALPKMVEVAVLVDRKHKSFPIKADYVGLSLATTLKDDIDVRIRDLDEMSVHLN